MSTAVRTDRDLLRVIVVAAGLGWCVLFIVVGLVYRLELYGDGAMFSYAIAAQDVWAFHWHNISGRLTTYVLTMAPAEGFVALNGCAAGGVFVYGLLFFLIPLFGLLATFSADRSRGRIIFAFACASTAVLDPLVFGFPSEMWMAHAWFWPALAVGHYAPRSWGGNALVFATLFALMFSHEGGFVLAGAILFSLMLRGIRDVAFLRVVAFVIVVAVIWVAVQVIFPTGPYFADVYLRAALGFFDLAIFRSNVIILLVSVLVGFGIAAALLTRLTSRAPVYAAAMVVAALALYWCGFDHALHASNRYYMRTLLVVLTPLFGIPAALYVLDTDGRLRLAKAMATRVISFARSVPTSALIATFLLVTLVQVVETAKFLGGWTDYKAAVRRLATGTASDPALGDPRFVSSDRIGPELNRLSWFSTTPYLSAILAEFAPARLVVDPSSNYFWLSCATATANLNAPRAIPRETRVLVRTYSCEHR